LDLWTAGHCAGWRRVAFRKSFSGVPLFGQSNSTAARGIDVLGRSGTVGEPQAEHLNQRDGALGNIFSASVIRAPAFTAAVDYLSMQ
jgi:hypothetical protein